MNDCLHLRSALIANWLRLRRGMVMMGMGCCLCHPSHAQTRPDAGRLLDEAKNTARSDGPSLAPSSSVVDEPLRPTIRMPEGLSVNVSSFKISGASSFSESELASLLEPWVGKRLDFTGLNDAAGAITRHYQKRGHLLSYAYLPAQRIGDGVVEIAVLEGRLENVQVVTAQDVRLMDEVVQAHVGELTDSKVVSRADLERRMLLLNDLAGVVARASIVPGTSTGKADIVVSLAEDDPLESKVEINNYGAASTGQYRVNAAFQFRDLFGWGDSSSARIEAGNRARLVNFNLSTHAPAGGSGLHVGGSLSRLNYQLAGNFSALGAMGQAVVTNININYPIVRSLNTNLRLIASLDHKKLQDEIQVTNSLNPKSSNLLGVGLSFDAHDDVPRGASTHGSLSLAFGTLHLDEPGQLELDNKGLKTAGNFGKLNFNLGRQHSLGDHWSVWAQVNGQRSGHNLDSSEKFALGGPSAVRAYAPGEATVDAGSVLALELRYTQNYAGGGMVWSLFHDHGWGRINNTPLEGATGNRLQLLGSGIGLQWTGDNNLGVNVSVAKRGARLPTAEGGDPGVRVYLQLNMTL